MSKKSLVFTLALFLVGGMTVQALTVDEVIKNHIDAVGGMDKLKSIQTMKVTLKFQTQGIEGPAVVYTKRPNLFRLEATIQGMQLVQAFDGETGWMISPFGGNPEPQKLNEQQTRDLAEEADIDGPLVDHDKKGHTVELLGEEELEGTPVYKLKLTLKSGNIRYIYLDKEYFLPIKITSKVKQGETEYEVDTYQGDYKEVDGMMMAHSTEIKMGGQTMRTLTVEKVEMNEALDDAMFKMPEKVEASETKQDQ